MLIFMRRNFVIYSLTTYIVSVVNLRELLRDGHVALIEETKEAYEILMRATERTIP
jgi:hypothetical protein